jgi:hypothetical protein
MERLTLGVGLAVEYGTLMQNVQNLKGEAMGDAGAFVALFRFHSPFLSNEEHLLVLFQPARQCQALAGGDISPHQPLNVLSLLLPNMPPKPVS